MFEQDDDLGLGEFKPKAPAPPEQVRGVAEQEGFRSREPKAAPTDPPPVAPERREPRRYRTGRNVQLNLKVRQEAVNAFYRLADERGWVLGEVFERAVSALEKELREAAK
jgi:hypothetical protein